jgi:hypothetical protein
VCYNKDTKKERATAPKERKHTMNPKFNYSDLAGYPHNSIFTVIADNYEGMEISFKGKSFCMANTIAFMLMEAFRDVKIVDDTTGEVMFNHYESADLFTAHKAQSTVICDVMSILAER